MTRCDNCGRQFRDPPEATGYYPLGGAFPTTYTVDTITCKTCQNHHRRCCNMAIPGEIHSWNVRSESMIDGKDFEWGNTQYKGAIDGSKPLNICWAWLPFSDENTLAKPLLGSIKSDEEFRRRDCHSLLVMEFDRFPKGMIGLINMFDGVVLLKNQVMAGASGPYPSLRAEKSIVTTFAACNLRSVKHYWPAVTLEDRDYVEIADQETMRRALSRASRRNLTIERTV